MITKLTNITCDFCFIGSDCVQQTAAEVRKEINPDGWTNKGAIDLCPECSRKSVSARQEITFQHHQKRVK